jgi:hypothetical protein
VVKLITQTLTRIHLDAFDLKSFFDVQHLVISPGTDFTF